MSAATAIRLTSPEAIEGKATSIPSISGLIRSARLSLDFRDSRSRKTAELKLSGTNESNLVNWASRSGSAGEIFASAKSQ